MKIFKENKWLVIILLVSFLVRYVGIAKYPVGFTQDEAGIGFDAYCLLKTGKDTWGKVIPLTLRSFGDFKLPLYSYLAIPSVLIFGLNEFAVRLPGVILGALAVLATYLMVEKLSGNKKLSLWSALFLALSPWHMPLSRGAFEANLTTFFIPLGVYFFYKGLGKSRWMIFSAFCFGLNLFSYHSARLIIPLIILGLIYFNKKHFAEGSFLNSIKIAVQKYKWSFLIVTFFVFLVVKAMFSGANSRALDVTIFNPTDGWFAMSEKRFYLIMSGLDMNIARLFVNKFTYVFGQFIQNYFKYVSPQFMFTDGVSDWSYGMIPGRGVLYLFEVITFSVGILAFIKRKNSKDIGFFIFWILVSPIPAALTKGGGAAGTRAAAMMPAIQILSAYGLVYSIKLISNLNIRTLSENVLQVMLVTVLVICFAKFVVDYVYYMPTQAGEAMQTGRDEMAKYLDGIDGQYDKIRVSRSLGVPHIWIMFYQKWDPVDVQKYSKDWLAYDDGEKVSIDQYDGYKLGKYIFGNIFYEDRSKEVNTLFVGRPEDFPYDVKPLKIIENSAKKPSVFIVESTSIPVR